MKRIRNERKIMRWTMISLFLVMIVGVPNAALGLEFAATYGGPNGEQAESLQITDDNGYIIAGKTNSFGSGSQDFWVLKLAGNGSIIWQKTYGGTSYEHARSIGQTRDGGYIIAGETSSFGAGSRDIWLIKLDSDGLIIWQKAYGGIEDDYATSIQQTDDDGYIVAGNTRSFGTKYDRTEFWLLKLDQDGNIIWQKRCGAGFNDTALSVQQTQDGNYIVAGSGNSGTGGTDFWILKFSGSGDIIWQKRYGGGQNDAAYSIQETDDGGYILAGSYMSDRTFGRRWHNLWILNLDTSGTLVWQKRYYGEEHTEVGSAIQQTDDGGYIVVGNTSSFPDLVSSSGIWVLKLDNAGDVSWQQVYGGINSETSASIQQTHDGGYLVAGQTGSFGTGQDDFFILKLDEDGNIPDCSLGEPTLAQIAPATVTSRYSGVVAYDTDAVVTTTDVSSGDTFVSPDYICQELPPYPTPTSTPETVIPEPATFLLFSIGLIDILAFARKTFKKKK